MAKKIVKKNKSKRVKVDFLTVALKTTLKQIKGDDSELDQIFINQAERIKKEMKERKNGTK